MRRSSLSFAFALSCSFVFTAALPAQRAKPTAEWQKRTTFFDHGTAPVGKHTLGELPIGQQWRLGMNEATTWTVGMPIVSPLGKVVVPPGQFRVSLLRDGEKAFSVLVQGSGHALGGGSDVRVTGVYDKGEKPAQKLELAWITKGEPGHAAPAKGKNGPNHDVILAVRYGDHELVLPMTLVGGTAKTVSGWTVTAFSLPVSAVRARAKSPVVVATFTKKGASGNQPEGFNLVLGKDDSKLVPWMKAPTDSFGFGEIVPPDPVWTTTGTVKGGGAADADVGDGADGEGNGDGNGGATVAAAAGGDALLVLKSASLQKGSFALEFTAAGDPLHVTVPEPKAGKK